MSNQCTHILPDSTRCQSPATNPHPHCLPHHLDHRSCVLAAREAALATQEAAFNTRRLFAIADLEARIKARDAEMSAAHVNFAEKVTALRRMHMAEMDNMRRSFADDVREWQRKLYDAKMAAEMREGERDAARKRVRDLQKKADGKVDGAKRGTRRKVREMEDDDDGEADDESDEREQRRRAKRVKFGGGCGGGRRGGDGDEEGGHDGGAGLRSRGDDAEVGNMLGMMNLGLDRSARVGPATDD